jgi:hypothetical protein
MFVPTASAAVLAREKKAAHEKKIQEERARYCAGTLTKLITIHWCLSFH